jgi:hypothetical protein
MDGKPSVNTHALNSLDGQGRDVSFFRYPFNTEVPTPRSSLLKAAAVWFSFFTNPLRLGVKPFTSWRKDGTHVANPSALYSLPSKRHETKVLYNQLTSAWGRETDFRTLLQQFKAPLVLFNVYARSPPRLALSNRRIELEEFAGGVVVLRKQSFLQSHAQRVE